MENQNEKYEVLKNELFAQVVEKHGYSEKTQKDYTMYVLRVETKQYGTLDIKLDTYHDRAGILLMTLPPDEK